MPILPNPKHRSGQARVTHDRRGLHRRGGRPLAVAVLGLTLAALACSQFGPQPTLPPPPASPSPTPSPGPETPTPRPESLTQPAAATATPGSQAPGTALPPLSAETFVLAAPIDASVPGAVQSLRFTPDGTLWLLTDQAVARLAGESWDVYLPAIEGELVGVDDLNRVWVADAQGASMAAWNGTDWQSFAAGEGWTPVTPGPDGPAVSAGVVADQQGRIWVATAQDVRAFDGEKWLVFDRAALSMGSASGEAARTLFTVHVARGSGTVWVSACDLGGPGPLGGGGVRFFDGSAWHGAGTPLDQGCGGAIASSADGRVWIGLDARLLEFDPDSGEFTELPAPTPPSNFRFGSVVEVTLDPSDRPWPLLALCGGASCDSGLARYSLAGDGAWTQVGEVSEVRRALLFDLTGSGWLLGPDGAQRVTAGQVQTAGEVRVLASALDSGGQIYVAAEQAGAMALWIIRPGDE